MKEPFDYWPILSAAFKAINNPPGIFRGRGSFTYVIARDWDAAGCALALGQMREFLAGGDDEARCRWLMDDMASMYDPLVDFESYRECVLWVRDQLEASAAGAT
jgi:hypothetical protein